LGGLLFFDDDFAGARREWEAAFREFIEVDEQRAAALVTADLADLFVSGLGQRVVGESWQNRGRRLLDSAGRCVERGYVDLALIACEMDVAELQASSENAAVLADEFGDAELAVLASANAGYARVVQADIAGGFALLDDAMTSLSSGVVHNPAVVGKSYCALMSACDRSGDVRRGLEWIDAVRRTLVAPLGGRPRPSRSHCDLAYGSLMCTAGDVSEGEASILRVLGQDGTAYAAHRTEAVVRLASLRLTQGRAEEAAELLRPVETGCPLASPWPACTSSQANFSWRPRSPVAAWTAQDGTFSAPAACSACSLRSLSPTTTSTPAPWPSIASRRSRPTREAPSFAPKRILAAAG
jgi:hypothetical protein